MEIRLAASRIVDALFTRLTGRPPTLITCRHKELTSCASNVRLLAVSPTQTTVQCYGDRNHLQIVLCDQTQL
ncbi:unnamed protein product [Allacma fusca]|uniref:Uncharacterized protein n=1 Tax=Allacma fusca TaxID=39272 RepID=A0A8J2KJJ0_9HEXA|nr:unnamed protein product [Allacma fusca]